MSKVVPALLCMCMTAALPLIPAICQTSTRSSPASADQQFSAIDALLSRVADAVLDSSGHIPSALNRRPDIPEQTTTIQSCDSNDRVPEKSEQVDALRPLIQPILSREGIPGELAAVIQVESAGNPLALSPKGAKGLWQLMPDTARRYGLTVNTKIDERTDPEKSTAGAARYLRDLYAQFGSWPLALAAYNTGERNLQRAIDRAHSRDFGTLSLLRVLPAETRSYVPAVLARVGVLCPGAATAGREGHAIDVDALSGE